MPPRNVKIVATLGPSSSTREQIAALVDAGANVFRLNMSHGSHEAIAKIHENIREVESVCGRPIAILGDLQGPKLRCGVFANEFVDLQEGDLFRFDLNDEPGDEQRVCLPHPEIFEALQPGATLLVNDGLIQLSVLMCGKAHAECEVIIGGRMSNRKGVNVPSVVLALSSLSRKDINDLEFLCELGIDWLALSFVQRAQDVNDARELVANRAKIVSKIEKPAAILDFDAILEASDGIMVARGDLGVELPLQELPPIQKKLIKACRASGKPVIVATQMLESMIESPFPTRAEVSDVATALYDGADAVMLSAESAAGKYPVEAVKTMVKVALQVEADADFRSITKAIRGSLDKGSRDPITAAAREIADNGDIQLICCFTQSGSTALSAARERPGVPILVLTPDTKVARYLCLVWGLTCVVTESARDFMEAGAAGIEAANAMQMVSSGDRIALTAGIPFNTAGKTNLLRLVYADGSDL